MRTWRQLAPFLIAFSLIGNLWFGVQFYKQARDLNLYTWGNMIAKVWQTIDHVGFDALHGKDGRVSTAPGNAYRALETLELLQSLPHYSQRADFADIQTLRQFLSYAGQAYSLAHKEQGETGTISPESARRLAKIREGTEFIISHQRQTNDLKDRKNPWNHGEWRAIWRDIATGLRAMDFIPLPE